MGINPIDILEDCLKFKGFSEQSFLGKIKWIFLYPIALLLIIGIIIVFTFYNLFDLMRLIIKGNKDH